MDATHFLYALLGGILPALLWLWFWLREDHLNPEPRKLIVGAFLVGMVAVIIAIPLQKIVLSFAPSLEYQYAAWAGIEEILKFLAAGIIAFSVKAFDEPIDPVIYLITVAIGFAALENTLFLLGSLQNVDTIQSIATGNMRFIGATLVHIISSACIGLGIGLTFYRPKIVRFVAAVVGLCAGIALHSLFNLSIIDASPVDTLKTFGWVWAGSIVLLMFFEEIKVVRPRIIINK